MSTHFILQVAGVATGGSLVQLLVFLLRRRAEIRSLDRTSDAGLLTSANELIARLQTESAAQHAEVQRLDAMSRVDRENFTRQLAIAHEENSRLTAELAQLRTELDIQRRQIDQLRRYGEIPEAGRHRGGTDR